MSTKPERLFTPFAPEALSAGEDGRGSFRGHANLKGCLETNYGGIFWGDSVYEVTDLLTNGFLCDTHGVTEQGYTSDGCIGTITIAKEDERGLYIEGKFHSTEKAQNVRTITQERLADGVSMGQSIGWLTLESFRIFAKDYASELPKYLKPEFREQGMLDAKMFPSIVIRTKVKVIEDSITPYPAMKAATVMQVLSEQTETLASFLPEGIEHSMSLRQISALIDALYWCCAYKAFCNSDMDSVERRAYWEGCLAEFTKFNLAIFDQHESMTVGMNEDEMNDDMEEMASMLRTQFNDPKVSSPLSGLRLEEHTTAVLSTVENYIARQKSLSELRENKYGTLSGKVVSKDNHKALQSVSDKMQECKESLDAFLEKYKPVEESAATTDRAFQLRAHVLRSKLKNKPAILQ